jgi:hypothetical protein
VAIRDPRHATDASNGPTAYRPRMSEDGPTYCDGCGERVPIPEPRTSNPMVLREPSGPAAGRVSWIYGGLTVHQCADGSFLPPDEVAPPRAESN